MRGKRKIRRGRKEKKRRGRRGEINKKRKKEEKEEEKKKGIEEKKKLYSFLLLLFFLVLFFLRSSPLSSSIYPPSALSLDQNSRGHPNPREKTMLVSYPLPPRPYPTNSLEATQIYQVKRALSSRPPQTLEALSRPPQTLEALPIEATPNPREAASRPLI